MPYRIRQWVEVNGIPRPEFEYEDPDEAINSNDSTINSKIDSLLDKPFDELTTEEWQLLKETDMEF